MHTQFREVGFDSPSSHVIEAHFHFATATEHWAWLMSNGHRFTIDRVEPANVEHAKAALAERLEEHRDRDGYRFDRPTRFTLAQRKP